MPVRTSYRAKLLWWILPVLVLGLAVQSFSSYWQIHHAIETELTRATLDATSKSAETIGHWLGTLLLEPETIAATPAAQEINQDFHPIDNQNAFRYKLLHAKYADMFLDVYSANRFGKYHTVEFENNHLTLFEGDISDRPYFRSIMAGGPAQFTQPLVSRTTGQPTIFAVAPIRDDQGRPQGLVGAGISLDYVKKVAESLTAGKSGYGFIIARDGTFISHPDRNLVMHKRILDLPEPSVVALGRRMLAGGSGSFRYTYGGEEKIAFYVPIPIAGWSVATTLSVRELFMPATRVLQSFVLVTALSTLAAALIIILAARHTTGPLLKLARHASQIGTGGAALGPVDIRSGDEIGTLAATLNRMTLRLQTTLDTLSTSERKYRSLVDNLSTGIFRSQPESPGRFEQVNPAMLSIFAGAREEGLGGLALRDLFGHAEQWQEYLDRLAAAGSVRTMETAMRRLDGSAIWCQVSAKAQCDADGRVVWIDGVIEDVTEWKRMQDQLRHSQKMQAIGTLAGGIAHEFNNLLTAILAYGNLALELAEPDSQARACAQQILASAEEASKLTRGLLAMSRKEAVNLQPMDLNAAVRKIELLMARIIGPDIEFRASYAEGELLVLGDGSRLEQVLMNLVANARDAMPGGGKLAIVTSLVEIAQDPALPAAVAGTCALVSVSDTGQGMDEETRQRIFEPFFTTKEAGKGTGLGLSIAYGIIKQHNGEINVSSEPGGGSTFRFYLKCLEPRTRPEVGLMDPAVGADRWETAGAHGPCHRS